MIRRIVAVLATCVFAVTGFAVGTASAGTATVRPHASVTSECGPLVLANPTRSPAEFRWRVVGHDLRSAAVAPRTSEQRSLRPEYGQGALTVQWIARLHDSQAKARAVRAAEEALKAAQAARDTAKAARDQAEAALPEKTADWPGTWAAERDRLLAIVNSPQEAEERKATAREKVALIDTYLTAENALADAVAKVADAQVALNRARSGEYWTRWWRGTIRVDACPTPGAPPTTPTEEPTTSAPTPPETTPPAEEPEPEPAPTATTTTVQRVVRVINEVRVPTRIDTGGGGLAA
ncbi:hypothetical protein C1I98_28540 [Spongiactinospora gelatinilytica]|uniref:Uncharacterized protein n=1 Tax=Spongiactinospora gelatinilytica TaxID=2666298 RepID=A0A2W2FUC7_9ACTN|nr:hypothetical protein [Spongiactinospora gelatinilytica]PZG33709.1 hypothetical protein C1I98_28540 [Spongiactinospora gelatinilytica]